MGFSANLHPLWKIALCAALEVGAALTTLGLGVGMRFQVKRSRSYSTQPLLDRVVQHKGPLSRRSCLWESERLSAEIWVSPV